MDYASVKNKYVRDSSGGRAVVLNSSNNGGMLKIVVALAMIAAGFWIWGQVSTGQMSMPQFDGAGAPSAPVQPAPQMQAQPAAIEPAAPAPAPNWQPAQRTWAAAGKAIFWEGQLYCPQGEVQGDMIDITEWMATMQNFPEQRAQYHISNGGCTQ